MDWIDIGLHVGIALASILFFQMTLKTLGLKIAWWLNTLIWPIREGFQHYPNLEELFTHKQSLAEWGLPVVFGWLLILFLIQWNEDNG